MFIRKKHARQLREGIVYAKLWLEGYEDSFMTYMQYMEPLKALDDFMRLAPPLTQYACAVYIAEHASSGTVLWLERNGLLP